MSWYDYLNPVRWFTDEAEEAATQTAAEPHKRVHLCSGCRQPGHNIRTCQDLTEMLARLDTVEAELAQEQARNRRLSTENRQLADECARLRARLARLTGDAMAVHSQSWR